MARALGAPVFLILFVGNPPAFPNQFFEPAFVVGDAGDFRHSFVKEAAPEKIGVYQFELIGIPAFRTIRDSAPSFCRSLGKNELRSVLSMIGSPDTYSSSPSLQTSCVFLPTVGLHFTQKNKISWWLISTACRESITVTATADWRSVVPRNLSNSALENIRSLTLSCGSGRKTSVN